MQAKNRVRGTMLEFRELPQFIRRKNHGVKLTTSIALENYFREKQIRAGTRSPAPRTRRRSRQEMHTGRIAPISPGMPEVSLDSLYPA
jgi:hypothetical protein